MVLALAFLISFIGREFYSSIWSQGGSINFNYLPLIIYALRNKFLNTLLTVMLFAVMAFFLPDIVLNSPWQLLTDGVFQYLPLVLVCCFKNYYTRWRFFIFGLFICYFLMFVDAFFSGILFYCEYNDGNYNCYLYSLFYNLPIFFGSWVLVSAIWVVLMRLSSFKILLQNI